MIKIYCVNSTFYGTLEAAMKDNLEEIENRIKDATTRFEESGFCYYHYSERCKKLRQAYDDLLCEMNRNNLIQINSILQQAGLGSHHLVVPVYLDDSLKEVLKND